MRKRVHMLPKTVISSASNTYAKKRKRLGMSILPLGRLKMVIFTYSNILLSVSLINMTTLACWEAARYGHLDCLKYLHETAKAPWDDERYEERTRTTTRMCTIPPRQQLSSPTWLAIRRWRVARARIRNRNRNRNRNRIITRVLQPPHPCNTKRERERAQNTPAHFSKTKKM